MTTSPRRTSGSTAMDDYLEQILNLIEAKGYARAVDISKNLNISQASVTNMLQRLDAEGLVKHEKYRGTTLTEEGHRIARAIIERHDTLTRFLRFFDIDEEAIYHDVEGMEHQIFSTCSQLDPRRRSCTGGGFRILEQDSQRKQIDLVPAFRFENIGRLQRYYPVTHEANSQPRPAPRHPLRGHRRPAQYRHHLHR